MSDLSTRLEGLSRQERAALLELLRKRKGEPPAAAVPVVLPPRAAPGDLPLSFAQQRLWFIDRLAPGSPLYNVPGSLRCTGRLDPAVLAACLSEVVRRHAALRTRFEIRGDGPVQVIEPAAPLPLPLIDLSALPEAVRLPEAERIVRAGDLGPFDLTRPPLMRARLLRLGAEEHLFAYVFHHIASDAWSLDVAVREVAALYPAFLDGRPSPLPELSLQYADFAWEQVHTLRGEALERELAWWRPRLAGAPVLELPTDRSRPAVPSFRGAARVVPLDPALEAGLRDVARQERVTLFMAQLAPVCALLARLAGSLDVVAGTTVAGRDRLYLRDLIGFFVNTLVLRFDLAGDPDRAALLAQAREVALGAFAHQALPFEKLVDELGLPRDPYRPPLLRVLFQFVPVPQTASFTGLTLEPYRLSSDLSKFDLLINAVEENGHVVTEWRYDADLFDAATIDRWTGSFDVLLGAWLADASLRVSELPLLTAAERRQLLTAWNPEPPADRGRRSLPAMFEAQVDRSPDADALSSEGSMPLTYRELDARASRLARWLVEAGVVPGDRVALRLDRSPDLVVSLLAVLKTGAAYVPLDPASPEERLAFALEDSGASLLLDAALLEREAGAIARQSGARLGLDLDPELPAYVIYTSGSTGRPKGVVVPHGAVARLFSATDAWFGFGPGDVWTLFHSYAFDFSVWEIWGALLHGGRLVVVPWSVSRDPEAFLALLARERVTVLNQTPSAFRQMAAQGSTAKTSLRLVIFGGEALDPSMLAPWFERYGDAHPRLVNMYGITETTVHVTYRPLSREDAARPASMTSLIGRPIPDLTVHVLDRRLEPQPLGIPGELCVGGEGLAHGYLGRPDLTAARFVPDPFGPRGSRLYRSGDLARRRPDGDLEFLGRIDTQVKIRGFRIELGEIEAALTALPGVREAVALARRDGGGGELRLAAYVTAGPEGAPSLAEMRETLGRRLPDYMIPSALVVLDRLPLTSNGKVDRRALPDPDAAPAAASGRAHVPPRDALESHLAGLFRQVLSVPAAREIGALDDFFELGGSSISGAILVNRLQETLGEIVHVVVIFDHPTVEALAAYVRDEHPAAAARLWGVAAQAGDRPEEDLAPAGPAELAEMRRLIVEGRPEPEVQGGHEPLRPLNPPAVFLLSPPRSGSTLLRLMLGAHPRLFAPPELELLSFRTLASREAAFAGRDRFWLEGVLRAVMEARACDADEAGRIVAAATAEGWTTRRFYRELQGWIGDRLLVDKTPSYALDPAILRRGEEWFAEARYIHLLRHPQATNRSFEEARLDQIFFRRPHAFPRRQLAELIWTVSHRNILDFLIEIPAARQWTVRFEDLVREPERVLAGVCGFLGLGYDPAMADPYREGAARMADGVRAESRMLGDVKFLAHGRVDAAAAERWRQTGVAPLGEPARQLAAELAYDQDEPAAAAPLVSLPRDGSAFPLSFAQQRLWFLDRLQPGTPAYNIPSFFRLEGRLDPGLLERVLGELVRRHESLRTTFEEQAGEPRQRIHPPAPVRMPRVDLRGLPEAARAGEARRLAREEVGRGFSLERGPLLRAILVRLGEQEHALLTTVHHIVSDGWSTGVMAREVSVLYDAFRSGLPAPLPELPLQYVDFAVWQRGRLAGAALESELSFWRLRLADLPAVLPLPTDRPRPPVQGFRGGVAPVALGAELSAALAALGRRERTTPFMTLLAAFQVLLGRVTGQERFGVGTPVAGRNRVEIEPLIGFFVNTLVLRADLSAGPSFLEVLRRVREEALAAQLHQELPFEKLVEGLEIDRSLSHAPLFQVMFAFQNAADARLDLPGLSLLPMDVGGEIAKFDLDLTLGGDAGGLAGAFSFSADLFDATTIQRLAGHLQNLLEGLVADPAQRVWEVPLLAPPEFHQLLVEWNDTRASREAPLLHRLVEEQAARTPGAVAVEAGGACLTYAGLVERASRQARRPGSIVALSAERSPELIVDMLAVLQAGAAYLPVDPAYPEERRAFMVADAEAHAAPGAAYVIYTSGSTGRPKGVIVPHHAIVSFVLTARQTYGIVPGDRVLQFASLSFDTSGEEIWPALAAGATLVLRSEKMVSSISSFVRELERLGITVLDLPTAFWHEMVLGLEAGGLELPRGLRLVIIGGEEALADRLALWRRRVDPSVRLVNTYGPTETTIVATRRELTGHAPDGPVPIGRPIPGVRAYVLDRSFLPVPPGVRGELWIGGSGVARGYLGRPELTAERFIPDPLTDEPGARVYRTGDLAFLRPDGDLVFAGRVDRQVKVRGFRIELGDIEAALSALSGVREAAVVARGDHLVAYVAGDLHADALRQALRERLPDYMVPAIFVALPALPLTPNGKVDRKALPAPEGRRAEDGHPTPRTPVEETLAGLFVEILGPERTGGRVGVQDSFFDLGGHSLLATRLVAAVRDVFRVDLPLRLLFERPTVEGLARAILEVGETGAPADEPVTALPRGPGENRFPVSFAQLREWILDRLEPGNPAYNIAGHLRIEGPLSIPVLTGALRALVRRHEVFRTAFIAGEEEPLQVVLSEARLEVPVIDLSALPEGAREAELLRRVRDEDGSGFDLAVAPLLRARVVRLRREDHALLLTVHHIVSDGWSSSILNQELAALYEGAPLPALPVQYADYAVWQRGRLSGEALKKQEGFWRQRLTGAPPLLELPTDRPRPPVRSNRGGKVPVLLPQPLAGRLEELARRCGASLFMLLLAGYQALLARWSGQDDVVVGTYSGNRPRRELEGLIGFFINTLVLRTHLTGDAGDPPFTGLIRRVRETTLEAYAHRDVPFEKLLEILQLPRDPSRTPLFQALLVLQNFPPARVDLSTGVRLRGLAVEREKSDYDLALWLGDGPEGITGTLQYSTDLFDEATIVRFAGHLRALLEAAVADPERNVWTLPLVSEEEQARQLEAWSRGPAVPAGSPFLHRLVEEQAVRTPDTVAVEAGSSHLTYAELVEQARRFARRVSPGEIVALAAERTPELIVQMLGVLQAGAAYLPIDPAYPRERRELMLEDSGANTAPGAAYVIYTSGSTGLPKGVVVPHRAISSFVRAAVESYGLAPGDRVLQFASISFDTSAEEIWPAMAAGATLVLRPEGMAASIPHFLRELQRLDITVLDLPTAFWHELVAGLEGEEPGLPRGLRLVILGGEEALADRFALWRRRVGSAVRLVNTYGPTEATIVATRRELANLAPGCAIPIGRPIPGARAYVLDRFLAPVPPGVRGELWIGGAGVARGYLGRPELTADRFWPDPFAEEPGARLYRTGDLAVLRPDGDLVFAGRADRQLKIRGYRIEPGEIEATLRLHPAVRDAVVDARGPGDARRLIAWIVPREGIAEPAASEVREHLRDRLPDPLVPAAFVVLAPGEGLPLTPGGKVDRRALQEPAEARPEDVAWAEPQSALERTIAEIYRDLLRAGRVGLHDNFFDLGGHSLLVVRAHQKLKAALGREIPVLDLFRFPTVAALARHLGGEETGSLRKVRGLAERQRAAQQRQRTAMERLRRPDRR